MIYFLSKENLFNHVLSDLCLGVNIEVWIDFGIMLEKLRHR